MRSFDFGEIVTSWAVRSVDLRAKAAGVAPVRLRICFLSLWASACLAVSLPGAERALLLLVSMDGFRWDYLERYAEQTPRLRQLRANGVSARSLIPVFPTNTFPNHYSIVTGLRPSRHGIVNNRFFDGGTNRFFNYTQPSSNREPQWWGGEPIWVTAERQGLRSACYFWPGSEAAFDGVRPAFWKPYDYSIPFEQRVSELVQWLTLSPGQRPSMATFYFEETNSVGHRAGPDSDATAAAVQKLDTQLGQLLDRLQAEGIAVNVVVVSDHGMARCEPDQAIVLEEYVDLTEIQIDFEGSVAGLRPAPGQVDAVLAALAHLPAGAKAYRAEALPGHFHVTPGPRWPPIIVVGEQGWHVVGRVASLSGGGRKMLGDHGYDPALPDMHGILIAHGPAFARDGRTIVSIENIHLYNVFCAVLGIVPAANDGDARLLPRFGLRQVAEPQAAP
jgi:predicted AlkP superfamily pyrophosphatase or phosphodiesterase